MYDLMEKIPLEKNKKHDIEICEAERRNPFLLHAKVGGFLAKSKYKVDDEEIIDCKLTLYLLLLAQEKNEQDKMFKEFEVKYNKLTKEKQEYIREDLKRLFEEQDKNNKEKEKNYGKNNRYRFRYN